MRAQVSSIELGGAVNLAVLAPIKPGFVDGFETLSYLDRLRRLLQAMHSSRQNVRESELRKPVFADAIGRFGIIQSFRYAIVPPRAVAGGSAEPGVSHLSLNVSFDGAWEPYMRVIYRDIGTLLDALFCHCVGYPGSTRATFDDYCRWVRNYEIGGGIFYTDSPISIGDQRYLGEVERLQRETSGPSGPGLGAAPRGRGPAETADEKIARFALPSAREEGRRSLAAVKADPVSTLALSLRTLKGLYRLSTYFPDCTDDGGVLIRFAQSVLREFREALLLLASPGAGLDPKLARQLEAVQLLFEDELHWLARDKTPPARPARKLACPDGTLQGALFPRDDPVTHGCVVMLAVRNGLGETVPPSAVKATAFLASRKFRALCGAPADANQIRHHVAFTHAGLVRLGVDAERLDALPPEFAEGMEARCGLLGDVRGNHPDRWARPLRHGRDPQRGERIDLTAVHVVVVLRLLDPADNNAGLHPRLAAAVASLEAPATGLVVLAVQPTRSYRNKQSKTVEHFGFVDGLSQPRWPEAGEPDPAKDEVPRGELLLGYANGRGDGPVPDRADPLLDNGTFLVMRKLRQDVEALNEVVRSQTANPAAADEVRAKMMGRQRDGTPWVAVPAGAGPNGFNFDADPAGAACPFHSHVRRTNPRDGRAYLPRILRRGMSYGPQVETDPTPGVERGIVFMAYCASIAEQFEIIQRWVAGGNSSGVSSSQSDPFLGVPQAGERRVFRYLDAAGKVARVDLGRKPLVQLEWGLYLFVPSLKALGRLPEFRRPAAKPIEAPEEPMDIDPPEVEALEVWRRRLEDRDHSKAAWQRVREEYDGRVDAPPYGTLLGTSERVLAVLKDRGKRYSVAGYGERMKASIGLNHLGMDPAGGHDRLGPVVNAAIEAISAQEAFEATLVEVGKALDIFKRLKQPDPAGPVRVAVDMVSLSELVLAGLCARWVGLPDPDKRLMTPGGRVNGASAPPRCPGHLLTTSRYVFAPHPRPAVVEDGPRQGRAALKAVKALLAEGGDLGTLGAVIQAKLKAIGASRDEIARNLAGVLLGFPPTVHGNFVQTMETWIEGKVLWACQQRLAEVSPSDPASYDRAQQALLQPLLATMRERPIPEVLWRCPVAQGRPVLGAERRVVLGIASALTDPAASPMLMFGGSRETSADPVALKTVHACPGYGMGIGVLLGLIAGLLDAGTLRPTGSPVLLMLTPNPNPN